jgi:serine/threonine protein kinase
MVRGEKSLAILSMPGSKRKVVGQYRVLRELGRGAFGQVFLAELLATHETRAIKALLQIDLLNLNAERKASAKRYLDTEIRAMREIKSEYIVRLYDVFSTKRKLYLVMEYCDGGSLKDRLQRPLPFQQAVKYFQQLASALVSMHAKRYVHRDLKPDNVLLQHDSVKLGDFGLAKQVTEATVLRSAVGTRLYMAPEVLSKLLQPAGADNSAYNERADYWSAGVILYEMILGRALLAAKTEIDLYQEQHRVCSNPQLIEGLEASPDCKDLLKRLIVYSPADRISMEDFRKHPFVTGVPRLSQIDFYSLVSFSKPPLYQLVPAVALRLAVLLSSWALDSPSAFVYYLKACKALEPHVDSKVDCQELFCKTIKQADAVKPESFRMSPTLIIVERVSAWVEEVAVSGADSKETAKHLREAWLVLDLVRAYPQVLAFKRRLERKIEALAR